MHNEPENDPVWDLLGNASKQEADSMFSRDVIRSIRLDEQETASWWQRLLRPAPLAGTLATAAACIALIFTSQTDPISPPPETVSLPEAAEENLSYITDIFDSNDELDDLLNPISLLVSNDIDLQEFEAFMKY